MGRPAAGRPTTRKKERAACFVGKPRRGKAATGYRRHLFKKSHLAGRHRLWAREGKGSREGENIEKRGYNPRGVLTDPVLLGILGLLGGGLRGVDEP